MPFGTHMPVPSQTPLVHGEPTGFGLQTGCPLMQKPVKHSPQIGTFASSATNVHVPLTHAAV
jgi:hypothetical protein